MRKIVFLMLLAIVMSVSLSQAGFLDNAVNAVKGFTSKTSDNNTTVISGLKEALSIGTRNAVGNVSRVDGYFSNEFIKIIMPDSIRNVADVLSKVGFSKQVDDFVLSMNRAAENAGPKALSLFVDAIKQMSFEDAKKILNGGDTAATKFFKEKTHGNIYNAFKPAITTSMNDVGVTRMYKQMMNKYNTLPLVPKKSVDLDDYVTNKAMDGLFYMVGEEEKKIRTDPAARVTDLLKEVFK